MLTHQSMTRSEFLFWRFVDTNMSPEFESCRAYTLVYEDTNTSFISPSLRLQVAIYEDKFEARILIDIDESSPGAKQSFQEIAEAGKSNYQAIHSHEFFWNEFSFDAFRKWVGEHGRWSFAKKG